MGPVGEEREDEVGQFERSDRARVGSARTVAVPDFDMADRATRHRRTLAVDGDERL